MYSGFDGNASAMGFRQFKHFRKQITQKKGQCILDEDNTENLWEKVNKHLPVRYESTG